jgi:prepilin-type processing-associated H-X9-DG protein
VYACLRGGLDNNYTIPYAFDFFFENTKIGWVHNNGANYTFVDGHVQWHKLYELTWVYTEKNFGVSP